MTKKLTKQWREGTLPEGFYYVKDYTGRYHYRYLTGMKPDPDFSKAIKDVLGKAANWEYYKPFVSNSDMLPTEQVLNLQKMVEDECSRRCVLETKCSQLEKRLEIAINALSDIEDGYSEATGAGQTVRQALKEMEGVK